MRTRRRGARIPLEVLGIDVAVPVDVRRGGVAGDDRVHRAHVGAGAAVDARTRIDVQHLGARVLPLGGSRMDAIDRADRDTSRVVAAVLGDHVRHQGCSSLVRVTVTGTPLKIGDAVSASRSVVSSTSAL